MTEFVNLNDVNDQLNIIPYNPTSIENIESNSIVLGELGSSTGIINSNAVDSLINIITIDQTDVEGEPEAVEDPTCGECDVANFYGDALPDGSFKRENLFSELIDEYQRAIARKNLGLGDEYSLLWGNIAGNILNQKDLFTFVKESTAETINLLITEINTTLAQWGSEIKTTLAEKAPLDSPKLTGAPTTTLPSLQDSSSRIPTTEWVIAKLQETNVGSLNYYYLSQDFMYMGDPPIELSLFWSYNEPIESQEINGMSIDVNARSYTISNVNSPTVITLSYRVDGVSFQKALVFETVYPIYYGSSVDYTQNIKTRNLTFVLDSGLENFGYIYMPKNPMYRIAVDNLVGGFQNLGITELHNTQYTLYKTINSGLGKLNITLI